MLLFDDGYDLYSTGNGKCECGSTLFKPLEHKEVFEGVKMPKVQLIDSFVSSNQHCQVSYLVCSKCHRNWLIREEGYNGICRLQLSN